MLGAPGCAQGATLPGEVGIMHVHKVQHSQERSASSMWARCNTPWRGRHHACAQGASLPGEVGIMYVSKVQHSLERLASCMCASCNTPRRGRHQVCAQGATLPGEVGIKYYLCGRSFQMKVREVCNGLRFLKYDMGKSRRRRSESGAGSEGDGRVVQAVKEMGEWCRQWRSIWRSYFWNKWELKAWQVGCLKSSYFFAIWKGGAKKTKG